MNHMFLMAVLNSGNNLKHKKIILMLPQHKIQNKSSEKRQSATIRLKGNYIMNYPISMTLWSRGTKSCDSLNKFKLA